MSEPFLRLSGVSRRFHDRFAVERVSLDVAAGELIILLGPSGCGKTTTLRIIAGLDVPDEGEIQLGGECVARDGRNIVPPHQRRVGFVFQDLALWPHLTIRESLNFVLGCGRVPKNEHKARVERVLALAHLPDSQDKYPAQLSGGEQQRAAIARALIAEPRLLLLDEPFSSLDKALKQDILRDFRELRRTLQITTVLVTHDPEEAEDVTDRVITMRAGRMPKGFAT